MKRLSIAAAAAAIATACLLPASAWAQGTSSRCTGTLQNLSAVSLSEARAANVDFSGSGGQLDSLLSADVSVRGRETSCLLIHFSAMAAPQDNHIIFQVLVDGVPVPGQSVFPAVPGIPVVYDPEESDLNNGRMVSHSFVMAVQPGTRRVEVKFAGCCSPNAGSGVVNSATLAVQYR